MKRTYRVTPDAPRDLRRRADANGGIELSAAEAEYELLRGTIVAAAAPDAVSEPGPAHPFDHDGDGGVGGSLPASKRGLDDLWHRLDELGVPYRKTYGRRRLQALLNEHGG